jgi:hypothetical protein
MRHFCKSARLSGRKLCLSPFVIPLCPTSPKALSSHYRTSTQPLLICLLKIYLMTYAPSALTLASKPAAVAPPSATAPPIMPKTRLAPPQALLCKTYKNFPNTTRPMSYNDASKRAIYVPEHGDSPRWIWMRLHGPNPAGCADVT